MFKRFARIAVLVLAVCPLFCAGCVHGTVRTFVKYEPKDDSFRCLQVYTNLTATTDQDADHLASLWNRRRSIILEPWQLPLFSWEATERQAKHKYCTVDLGTPPRNEPSIKVTSADLDSIRVVPGEFYLNRHGNLSYYHQVVMPGKVLDAKIKGFIPSMAEQWAEWARDYRQRAEKEPEKLLTWDEARKLLGTKLFEKGVAKAGAPDETLGERMPRLEPESIRLLIKAGADRSLKFSRHRQMLTAIVPLSSKDTQEVLATVDLIRDTIRKRIKAGEPVEESVAKFLESFTLRQVEGAGLEVSVDLVKLTRNRSIDVNPQPDAARRREYQATVAAIQKRGIAIRQMFAIEALVAEYVGP
jgi:hypothetical protein